MKVNILQPLKDYQGKPLLEESGKLDKDKKPIKEPVLMRSVILSALNFTPKEGKQDSAEEKMKTYELSLKVWTSDEIELTSEQISKIKANLAIMFAPLVAGQASLILEGKK